MEANPTRARKSHPSCSSARPCPAFVTVSIIYYQSPVSLPRLTQLLNIFSLDVYTHRTQNKRKQKRDKTIAQNTVIWKHAMSFFNINSNNNNMVKCITYVEDATNITMILLVDRMVPANSAETRVPLLITVGGWRVAWGMVYTLFGAKTCALFFSYMYCFFHYSLTM